MMRAGDDTMAGAAPALLRSILERPGLSFAMEAHDGLSALLIERAGFEAIWASGLAISTALGLRDASEATWSQVLDQVEWMLGATRLPVLLDGDEGHGNFNTVRRLVRRASRMGVAGICLEDKTYPKLNSFLPVGQELAEASEFCARLRAAKDAQSTTAFCVVARTEALVVGRPMSEALDRAHAYREAGADAVLVHSRQPDAGEVVEFAARWRGDCPLLVVPTSFASTPSEHLAQAGFSMAIWANHTIRACLKSMRAVCERAHAEGSVAGLEGDIASLGDIFSTLDYDELQAAQRRYGLAGGLPV